MVETENPDKDTPTASDRETSYLLQSEAMRSRLLEARQRNDGIPFEEICERFGIYLNEE